MVDILRNRWRVVFATVCGPIVGAGPVHVFAFGVFLQPVTAERRVGRGLFSAASTLSALIGAVSCPVFGWLSDTGVRGGYGFLRLSLCPYPVQSRLRDRIALKMPA